MLDIATVDTSLEAKRHDLETRIRHGRAAVALLINRRAIIDGKLEEATAGVRRLEEEFATVNAVLQMLGRESLRLKPAPPASPPAVVLDWPATTAPRLAFTTVEPEPFRPRAYFRCMVDGHDMVASRSHPDRITCRRCRLRRRL